MSQQQFFQSIGTTPSGAVQTINDVPPDIMSNINLTSTSGTLSITPDIPGNTVDLNVVNDGFPWSDQAASFSAQPQNGYFCTGALAVALPATADINTGSTIIIYVDTGSVVSILADTDQFIQIADQISSVGGNLNSLSEQGSTVTLVFRSSDLTWHTISSLGNWGVI